MNFKLNALVAAAMMAASVPAFAAMDGAASGNGSLLINFISQGGTSATAGGDDMSAVFDLGVNMDTFLLNNGVSGYTQTWSLTSANYGSAWNDLLAFSANDTAIEFNVIALDNVNNRYLTTNNNTQTLGGVKTYTSLTNANLGGFQNMDSYVTANNLRGTHATEANGASTALATDVANSYFRAVNGATQGDTWLTKTSDTTQILGTAQSFWSLSVGAGNGSAQAAKVVFGVDLDGNGSIDLNTGSTELGKWSVNLAAGTVTYANPVAVPEASTYGMMLAGLGLVGFMARRRLAA
jgi:hypothetical protein